MSQIKAIVDKLLTNVSSAYVPKEIIADKLLPTVRSKQYSGKLGKYGSSHLRIVNSLIGGEGKFRRVKPITRSQDSFQIEGHGLEGIVTKQDYANVEDPYDAEKDETLGLTTMLALEKEYGLGSILTSTSVLTQNTTLSGTSQFSDYLNSDPMSVFATARGTILDAVGFLPNVGILDVAVWNKLRFHPGILDALGFKQNRPGGLSQDELAVAMGVEKVMLASARYNSAAEGAAAVLAPCWGKHIVFAVLPDAAKPYQTSLGYQVIPEGGSQRKVYKYDGQNPAGSTIVLVEDEYDQLISNAAAGYLIKDSIA